MVLTSLNDTRSIELITPWGREKGLYYLGETFIVSSTHDNINAAIVACRRDLDTGFSALVTSESGKFLVWCSLAIQALSQVA